jgi:hypothetical protein
MNLQDVPVVKIDSDDGNKFIVAVVRDEDGEKKLVVRANQKCRYHFEIEDQLREEIYGTGMGAYAIGGGRITVNAEAKTINIWGESTGFGKEPGRTWTVATLQEAFPEFVVSESAP